MSRNSSSPSASARPRRTPVGSRNRLAVKNKEEGYVYRIVNDLDDRVENLQGQGYEIVTKESVGAIGDKRVDNTSSVGSSSHFSVGKGVKAVVMRIRKDWYEEDQKAKQSEIDATEATMKGNAKADYGRIDYDK